MKVSIVATAAVLIATSVLMLAQAPVSKMGEKITKTVTIQQIDSTRRLITFKTDSGAEDVVWAGPDFTRFNELKAGDKVNLTYYESTVYAVRKPGDPAPTSTGTSGITPGVGALPGGTMSSQMVQTVTVKSVDMNVPSITVTTSDGRTVSRKVENKSYLNGVKAGDKIDITYTEALLASVERGK